MASVQKRKTRQKFAWARSSFGTLGTVGPCHTEITQLSKFFTRTATYEAYTVLKSWLDEPSNRHSKQKEAGEDFGETGNKITSVLIGIINEE